MKRYIKTTCTVIATALASSVHAQDLSISSTVGFESIYAFRGSKLANETFQGSVDLSYGDFYGGVWTAQPVTGGENNEIDLYGGYEFALTDVILIDTGGTLYYYPEASATEEESTFEIYIGAAFDVFLSPSAYIYYDFDLETVTAETTVGKKYKLAKAVSLKWKAYLGGYDPDEGDSRYYYGLKTDFIYTFNETTSGSIGVRFSDKEDKNSKLYWGASFTAGF